MNELTTMRFNKDEINTSALYVLKRNSEGKFFTEYFEIDKKFTEETDYDYLFDIIKSVPESEQLSNKELHKLREKAILDFFEKIYRSQPDLFGQRSYCSKNSLRSSYCQYVRPNFPSDLDVSSDTDPENSTYMSISCGGSYYPFWWFMYDFFHSYFIEKAYEKCLLEEDIKAFSHRRVGWTTYNYILNEILEVDISTNFSYGSSSYFVLTLVLNGIKIVPYSRLVLYYHANVIQLIRHTCEYEVHDSSWQLAFDYVRDASNDFLERGEKSFIAKYVVNECEKLIELLPKYLDTDVFYLSENLHGYYHFYEDKFKEMKLEGYPLSIFRGEKVSGATNFIASLKELNKIIPTKKYIDCIIDCCIRILPELVESENEIEAYIKQLELQYENEKENCNNLEKQIRNITDHKALEALRNDLKEKNKICADLVKATYTHQQYINSIKKYKNEIEVFIETKEK